MERIQYHYLSYLMTELRPHPVVFEMQPLTKEQVEAAADAASNMIRGEVLLNDLATNNPQIRDLEIYQLMQDFVSECSRFSQLYFYLLMLKTGTKKETLLSTKYGVNVSEYVNVNQEFAVEVEKLGVVEFMWVNDTNGLKIVTKE